MNELDPDAPGVLAIGVKCGNCGTEFRLARYVGEPEPTPGTYTFEGNCPNCGEPSSVTAQVGVGPIHGE